MMQKDKSPLPDGLPARLADGDNGFARLCSLLDIPNRQTKRAIGDYVKSTHPKLKVKSTLSESQRLRQLLTRYYESARARRRRWQDSHDSSRSLPNIAPCLEANVMRTYGEVFPKRTTELPVDAAIDVDEVPKVDVSNVQDWQRPALDIWPDLRTRVTEWDSLGLGERDAVTLALFAVATILDDVRYLLWAVDKVQSLASEFAFAIDAGKIAVDRVDGPASSILADADERTTESHSLVTKGELMYRWGETCEKVAYHASALRENVGDRNYEEFQKYVNELHDLYESVSETVGKKAFHDQIARLAEIVQEVAITNNATWLHDVADKIAAQWALTYLDGTGRPAKGFDELLTDVDRLNLELKTAISEWREAEDAKGHLQEQLNAISAGDDIKSQLSAEARQERLYAQIAAASRRALQAKQRVLDALAPAGEQFDPSESYEPESFSIAGKPAADDAAPEPEVGGDDREVKASTAPAMHGGEADAQRLADEDRDATSDRTYDDRKESSGTIADQESDATAIPLVSLDDRAVEVVWNCLGDRPGIAYHVARLLSERNCSNPALPPVELVAAVVLADHAQTAGDQVAGELKRRLNNLEPASLVRDDVEIQGSLNLLLFAATVRLTVVAPSTVALPLLRSIRMPDTLSVVYEFAKALADCAERLQNVPLNPALFRTAFGQAEWSEKMESLRARARDWLAKAQGQRIIFGPANRVWMYWLHKSGCLGELVKLVVEAGRSERDRVRNLWARLSDEQAFRILVNDADREIRGGKRGGKRGSIEGRALPQLRQHAQPMLDLADEWLTLVEAGFAPANFVGRNVNLLRNTVRESGALALSVIDGALRGIPVASRGAALSRARLAVDSVRRLFDETSSDADHEAGDPDYVLSRDLLYVTEIEVDGRYRLTQVDDAADTLSMLVATDDHARTMRAAYDRRFRRGDLTGASLAFNNMEAFNQPVVDLVQCRESLERDLRRRRIDLAGKTAALRNELEQAFCLGQLEEKAAADLRADLVSVESSLSLSPGESLYRSLEWRADALRRAQRDGEDIRRSIKRGGDKGKAEAREKFTRLSADCDPEAHERINKAIEGGALLIANELMSRIEAGEQLDLHDETDTDDPFSSFMATVKDIERGLTDCEPDAVIGAISNRGEVAGVSFGHQSEVEAERAVKLMEAWYELSRGRKFVRRCVMDLFSLLGLQVRKIVETEKGRDWSRLRLETEPIGDRLRCPLPQFGSEASGRYRVLLNWGPVPRESIPQHLGGERNVATYVLHFGRLEADRERLKSWAVNQHRLFVVVDLALLVFLASISSGRLGALFQCTLPFADADPYITTSGLVPPELFFGRALERRRIMEPSGACFIYGGRQLGKTALLRSVEREFHRPETRQIAKWIDLKVREIGYARGPAEVWPLLWRELRPDVLRSVHHEPNPGNPKHVDDVVNGIKHWIQDGDGRRVLLLLDEADAFLELDARDDYRVSTRLKGLMEETDRCFKVVFAGLHNVLRMTERANHPLAHLGDPINVGPLLSNGEWVEAQKLVREPLRSVGYRFEARDLSTLILAQTNYYPSLIQLYGAELVRRLRDAGKTVPYSIQEDDIRIAYQSKALRNAIRERFLLTLQLDQRYEVIAYALAFELLEEQELWGRGLERWRIAECARAWWPDGFRDSDREFEVLLQEMEGLGVLRSADDGRRYALRNPNILLLLGNQQEIDHVLEKPREKPRRYEASSFRARYPGDHEGNARRGPLTYEQESMLRGRNGVAVIAGCEAAGIDLVKDFLSKRIEHTSFHHVTGSEDSRGFGRKLMALQPRSRNVVTIVLVSQREGLNGGWLLEAQRALKKKKMGRWMRVVFVADPDTLWRMMDDNAGRTIEVDWINVGPWDDIFLRRWLEDNNQPHAASNVADLMQVSGGWPMLVEQFVDSKRGAWDDRITRLRELCAEGKWMSRLAVTESAERELSVVLDHAPISDEDINSVAEIAGVDAVMLGRRMEWGKRLGLVSHVDGMWSFNSLVERLLGGAGGRAE